MQRRTVLLLVALLIAAVGTSLIVLYVRGVDARAAEGQDLVSVLVATETISTGERLGEAQEAGKVDVDQVRRADLVPGALSDVAGTSSESALATIHPGEQLLDQDFGTPAAATGLQLKAGQLAVSVALEDPQHVAGFVTPGSRVALYVSADVPGKTANDKVAYTELLIPEVQVLGVGAVTSAGKKAAEEGQEKVVFTLALDQVQAPKVIFAGRSAQVTFALLGEKTRVAPAPGVKLQDVVPNAYGGTR